MARRAQPKDGVPQASVTPHAPLPSVAGASGGDGGSPPVPGVVLAAKASALTAREKECLQLAARGMRCRDLAAMLGAPDVQTAIAWTSPGEVS